MIALIDLSVKGCPPHQNGRGGILYRSDIPMRLKRIIGYIYVCVLLIRIISNGV